MPKIDILGPYPSVAGRNRLLQAKLMVDSTNLLIIQDTGDSIGVTIDSDDAVELARNILAKYEPDALVKPVTRLAELPLGTFIRAIHSGTLAKVTAPTDPEEAVRGQNHFEAWVVTADGGRFRAKNFDGGAPDVGRAYWEPVPVRVTENWEVIE